MDKTSKKTYAHNEDLKKVLVPVVWCILLGLCSFALMALEFMDFHHRLGWDALPWWKSVVSPFAQEIRSNFLNLYISQISTTFLVTAFLSLLGDKDSPVYWTTPIDFKLVYPTGSGLKDFTRYSFFTLIISFIAMIAKLRLCFLFSFLVNIWILFCMTWRMIMAFYDTNNLKKDLKKQFKKMSAEQQQVYIRKMEENMIRAANEHDVTYLRDCGEFLKDIAIEEYESLDAADCRNQEMPASRMNLVRFIDIVPEKFVDLKLSAMAALLQAFGVPCLDADSPEKRAKRWEAHIEKALCDPSLTQIHTDPVITSLQEQTLRIMYDNIRQMPEQISIWALDMLIATRLLPLENHLLQDVKHCLPPYEPQVNFKSYFSDFVALLQKAYDNRRSIDPYARAIVNLWNLIFYGLHQIYPPDRMPKNITLFNSEAEAKELFNIVCSDDVLYHDYFYIYELLQNICQYIPKTSPTLKEELQKMLDNATFLGDDRNYIMTFWRE